MCTSYFLCNAPAATQIHTLSLHDALPICGRSQEPSARTAPFFLHLSFQSGRVLHGTGGVPAAPHSGRTRPEDRKSTRLNSSHVKISYAVFCLKKKREAATHLRAQRRPTRR